MGYLYKQETYDIVGLCMEVHSVLGSGFLESVYQEALEVEFINRNVVYEREKEIKILYKGNELSKYFIADFLCCDEIIVELKAVKKIEDIHIAQILNYLKATGKKVGLLVNFGTKSLEYRRFIL